MKYVIELIQQGDMGALNVHVFSEHVNHCDYAKHPKGRAVGAGFCAIIEGKVITTGKSTTLKMKPHSSDAYVLATFFAGSFESQRILLADLYKLWVC